MNRNALRSRVELRQVAETAYKSIASVGKGLEWGDVGVLSVLQGTLSSATHKYLYPCLADFANANDRPKSKI